MRLASLLASIFLLAGCDSDPDPAPTAEPDAVHADPDLGPDPGPDPGPGPGSDADADPDAGPDPEPDGAPDTLPDTGSEPDADADAGPPIVCPDPEPPPLGDQADLCAAAASDVLTLPTDSPVIALALGRGPSNQAGVGAVTEDGKAYLWRGPLGGDPEALGAWSLDGPLAGRLSVMTLESGYALVWGDDAGTHIGLADGSQLTVNTGARPIAAFASPSGWRFVGAEPLAYWIFSVSPEGAQEASHLVNNADEVGELWVAVEGELVWVPFTGPEPSQPLWFQTGSTIGGQCSLPTPLDVSIGVGSSVLATSMSYGVGLFAYVQPGEAGCPDRHRLLATSDLGGGFEGDSPMPFGPSARYVAMDKRAALVTLDPGEAQWQARALFVGLPESQVGLQGAGVSHPGAPPTDWQIYRDRDGYMLGWAPADATGVRLQRFCFVAP